MLWKPVSELDNTFDKLLEEAEKKAKEEAKKQPKIPEDLYRWKIVVTTTAINRLGAFDVHV